MEPGALEVAGPAQFATSRSGYPRGTCRTRAGPEDALAEVRAHFRDHCEVVPRERREGAGRSWGVPSTRALPIRPWPRPSSSPTVAFYIIENGVRSTATPCWGVAGLTGGELEAGPPRLAICLGSRRASN